MLSKLATKFGGAKHVLILAVAEWVVAQTLLLPLTRAWVGALDQHPLSSDGIFAENGRLALDLTVTHFMDLRAGAIRLVLGTVLWVLVTVPLQGVTAGVAARTDENPWMKSISRTPQLLAIALSQAAGALVLGYLLVRRGMSIAHLVLTHGTAKSYVLPVVVTVMVLFAFQSMRVFAHQMRLHVVADKSLKESAIHSLQHLRKHPFKFAITLTVVDLAMILSGVIATVSPASVVMFCSLVVQWFRVQIMVWWLRTARSEHERAS